MKDNFQTMKKLIIAIVVVGTILGILFTLVLDNPLAGRRGEDIYPINEEQEAEEDDSGLVADDDELEILPEEDAFDEEFSIEDEQSFGDVEEEQDQRRLIPRRASVSVYEGAFVKFSYNSSYTVDDETLTSLVLKDSEGTQVATADIYTNENNLPPYEFLQQSENIINYFDESESNNIVPEEIYLNDALHSVKFEGFPGVVTQDVYLIVLDGYLVRFNVQSNFEDVFNTSVLTFEKA